MPIGIETWPALTAFGIEIDICKQNKSSHCLSDIKRENRLTFLP